MSGPQSFVNVGLAAVAAAAAWVSLGGVAVTENDTHPRVFALPPPWLLLALAIVAMATAWYLKPRPGRLWPLLISAVLFLPYLPGPIPAAFLIWDGPIEWFVWATVIAGLLFDRPPSITLPSDPRRAPWIAGALAAICYATGWWAIADLLPGGDEPHYLVITQSLLLDGDLLIENNHERGDYRVYKNQPLKPDFIQRGKDGQIYPMHAPGVSALVLPAFAAAGYPGAVATVIAITAGASALAWQAAFLIAGSAAAAWLGWAAVFLTTPFFFHGFTIYPDGTAGLFTAAGVWLLVMLERRLPVATWQLAATGAALSVLPWLHARFALIAGALGGAIAVRLLRLALSEPSRATARWRVEGLPVFLAAPVLVAAAWFTYFWVIWGTPNPSAPQGRDLMMTTDMIWRGLPGLFFDQQFGLIAHAPIYALAIGGFALLARRHPRLSLELALASLPYIVITSSFAAWWGGVSAPARYLAALMPIAALPLAWWWREMNLPAWRATTLLLLLLSIGMVVPKLVVNGGLLAYNDRAGFDLFAEWIAQSVDLAMVFPSLHRETVRAALAGASVWLFALVAATAIAAVISRRLTTRGTVWAATSLIAMAAIMLAASVSWAMHETRGLRPATSQLALLRANPQTLGLEVRDVRRVIDPADPVALRASMLPPGSYALDMDPTGPVALRVEIGRTNQAFARWKTGEPPLLLRFPVAVHSVTVRTEAGPIIRDPRLQVVGVGFPWLPGLALRAARYGRTNTFFLDDSSYMEANGFWTRGEETTTIVFAADDAPAPLTLLLQAGPVPTSVTVSDGEWSERLDFAPNQQRPITRPAGIHMLKIQTGAWFRPSDRNPQDKDTRRLGVFGIVP